MARTTNRTPCLTLDFGPCLEYLFSLLLFRKFWHPIYNLMNVNPVWAALFFFFAFPKRLLHCCFAFSPHKVFKISHVQQLRNVAISNFPRTVVLFTYGNFSCTPRLPVLENKYTLDASPAQNKFQEIIQSGQAACRRNPKKTPSAFGREIL